MPLMFFMVICFWTPQGILTETVDFPSLESCHKAKAAFERQDKTYALRLCLMKGQAT